MDENPKKIGFLTPATDKVAYPTAKERMLRLVELQIRVLAQIDVIAAYGDEKDKLITREKVWQMAQRTDNGKLSYIYDEEKQKAKAKFTGSKSKGKPTDDVVGLEEFD